MEELDLMFAIFGVVEHITKSELTNIAKTLIYNYYKGSEQESASGKAREAVLRYTQCKSLPLLADIQKKTRNQLNPFEHLILRMEYEAKRADGTLAPAPAPETEPEPEQYSPPVPPSPVEGAGPFRVDEPVDAKGKTAPLPGPLAAPRTRVTQISSGFAGVRTTPRQPSGPGGVKRAGQKPSRPASKKKTAARPAMKRTPAMTKKRASASRKKAAGRAKAAPKKKTRARRK